MTPDWDFVVVGGGPAGMTAAQYASRSNLRTLVIEEMAPGGAVLLINEMENYPGFPEPVNGYEFSEKLRQQTENFGAVFKSAAATSITKNGDILTIDTTDGPISTWTAVISTGAKHKHIGVPGEEEFSGRGVSYCATCDGPFFKGKKILVIGGGDAACDEASYLAHLTDDLVMIHRRDRFRAQKALADRVLGNPSIDVRFNHTLERIEGSGKVTRVVFRRTDTNEIYEEDMDAVFIFIGSVPQTQIVPDLQIDEGGYLMTDQNMETDVKGLYAVGDVRATPFRQVVVACGEGAVAAHVAAAHIDAVKGDIYAGIATS
ncbi:MAG: FAD-dependent oxidoreductase [Spirochaetaceae bacterium]|nr:FAD-dependent oxidoreductase [Spirochaetaceae bacterium]MDT8296747.1 FAD-dependent oxidoreductase [Spirochaetaceae bacterium]